MHSGSWYNQGNLSSSKNYDCGFCGYTVAAATGYGQRHQDRRGNTSTDKVTATLTLCPHCWKPTFWDEDRSQHPGSKFGENVDHLPPHVSSLYDETRNCMAIGAYTAGAMAARKILMNVAVSHGAAAGASFKSYVDFLANGGFVPPNGKAWVDHIRDKGNEANHEIPSLTKQDLTDLIVFIEMLLKFIYEFPNRLNKPPATP